MSFQRTSWSVRRGSAPPAVVAALFVRDTLALSVDTSPDVPGLDPSVPVIVPRGVDRAAAAREWPGWWADVLEELRAGQADPVHDVAETSTLRNRPALRDTMIALRDEFYRFRWGDRQLYLPAAEVVEAVEARLGRKVKPFQLNIHDLPVRGLVWERIAPEHVLASTWFFRDQARCAFALRKVVEDLA